MFNTKIAVPVVAAMLALTMGLTACGSSTSTTSSSASSSSEATSSAAATSSMEASSSSSIELDEIAYYKGTFDNGDSMVYSIDGTQILIAIMPADTSAEGVIVESEPVANSDGTMTITNEDGTSLTFTVNEDMTIDIDGYGTAELETVTQADVDKEIEELSQNAA